MILCLLFSRVEQELWEIFKKINQSLAPHHQSYFPYLSHEHFIELEHVSSVAGATIYIYINVAITSFALQILISMPYGRANTIVDVS